MTTPFDDEGELPFKRHSSKMKRNKNALSVGSMDVDDIQDIFDEESDISNSELDDENKSFCATNMDFDFDLQRKGGARKPVVSEQVDDEAMAAIE